MCCLSLSLFALTLTLTLTFTLTLTLTLRVCGRSRATVEQHSYSHSHSHSHSHYVCCRSRATVVNNIFRNYGHQWVYNFDELRLAAVRAGFGVGAGSMCRSDRSGRGLPRWARNAMRRANAPRNQTQTCWLDQEVREGESLYVVAFKPRQAKRRAREEAATTARSR